MPKSFMYKDAVFWITGASAGLGKEMALQASRKGAKVALSARRKEQLETLKQEILSAGGIAEVFPCDVSQEKQIQETVEAILSTWHKLDVVIANAGFGVNGRIENLSYEDWERQWSVNVMGLLMTIKYSMPALRKSKGRIALLGSVAGFVPIPSSAPYAASKAAVMSIGRTLSIEMAGTGVSCTTLYPGFVESDIGKVDNDGNYDPDKKDTRPKKLFWKTDKAVKVMLKAIEKRKSGYIFTGHGRVIGFLGQVFPGLSRFLMRKTFR